MTWFRITLIEVELPNSTWPEPPPEVKAPPPPPPIRVRHPSTNGMAYLPPYPFRIHHEQGADPVDAMIGVTAEPGTTFPTDWIPMTLDEARALFQTFFGFAPTPTQVF